MTLSYFIGPTALENGLFGRRLFSYYKYGLYGYFRDMELEYE